MTASEGTDLRLGPERYIRASGETLRLGERLKGRSAPVVVTGEASFAAFHAAGGEFDPSRVLRYDGTVTIRDTERLASDAARLRADVIVGIGGGRVCDTAKCVADRLCVDCVEFPTIAATCASFSTISVMYDDGHRRIGSETPRHCARAVIVDSDIIASAPTRYLCSGIADTLAKWYEARSIISTNISNPTPTEILGLCAAKTTWRTLDKYATKALDENESSVVGDALGRVIDAVIPVSGAVAGFAGRNGRSSGAHAIHNALTAVPGTGRSLHGEKVAYGILVLLSETGCWEDVEHLLPLYRRLRLPRILAQTGARPTEATIATISEIAASEDQNFVLADPAITPEKVGNAIRQLETFVDRHEQ